MSQSTNHRIGIDLGGTKIEGILIDPGGEIIRRERVPTPREDYPLILESVDRLVSSLQVDPTIPVGIGTPGSISHISSLMRNSNSRCLNGKPLLTDLESQLSVPVRLANDADCFTLSEATDGAAKDSRTVFGVILGTGVGGGICIDGKLIDGVNGISGEWGHNPMPQMPKMTPGRACFCGNQDCIETWIAGPGLSRSYNERTGEKIDAPEIVKRQMTGETAADDVLENYYDQLAAALSTVINIIDPDTIVLGGGLSNVEQLYQRLPDLLAQYVFSDHIATRLVQAIHGDSSGVRGAAWLWP